MSKSNNPLNDPKNRSAETQLVHGGGKRSEFNETSEAHLPELGLRLPEFAVCRGPVHRTRLPAHNYSRFANPTVDMFQNRMALLEGAEAARAFATGMAAVTNAVMSQVRAGDHIVASRALFGGCRYVVEDLMPRFGVPSTLVDGRDPENFERAMQPNTKLVFIETPTNPTLELVDIAAVAKIAQCAWRQADRRQCVRHRRFTRSRSSSGPISSPIRRPSISTARAGCWAASCWAPRR